MDTSKTIKQVEEEYDRLTRWVTILKKLEAPINKQMEVEAKLRDKAIELDEIYSMEAADKNNTKGL